MEESCTYNGYQLIMNASTLNMLEIHQVLKPIENLCYIADSVGVRDAACPYPLERLVGRLLYTLLSVGTILLHN